MRTNAAEKFQGTPCKLGHAGLRYRSSGGCVECLRIYGQKRQEKKRAAARVAAWR